MFDIGFWEIALIGVIALLVVGPERLPALARNVGLWVGRVRRYVSHVKQDIERELHADEVRELLERRDGLADIREVAQETASVLKDARDEIDGVARASESLDQDVSAPQVDIGGSIGGSIGDPIGDNIGGETGAAAAPVSNERRVPHHAVDENPFAPSNLASVTPGAESPSDPPEESGKESAADHEQPTDRHGQH